MHQISFGGRAPLGPAGGAYSVPPHPLAGLRGPTSKGRGRGGDRMGEKGERKGRGGTGKGKGGREGERNGEGKGKGGKGKGGWKRMGEGKGGWFPPRLVCTTPLF